MPCKAQEYCKIYPVNTINLFPLSKEASFSAKIVRVESHSHGCPRTDQCFRNIVSTVFPGEGVEGHIYIIVNASSGLMFFQMEG